MVLEDTERTVASDLKEMINGIIREQRLSLWRAKTEMRDREGRQPDIVIFNNMKEPFCVIELKRPFVPPYQVEMFDQAYGYATSEGIRFFATFNLNTLVLWKTFEKDVPLLNRRFKEYPILKIYSIKELEKTSVLNVLRTGLEAFLSDLSALLIERDEVILPSLKLDTIFINYLHSLIEAMHIPLSESLLRKVSQEPKFRKKVYDWFIEQGWNFTTHADAVERLSRQYILLTLNKIMFYDILRAEYPNIRPEEYEMTGLPKELPKLKVPEDIEDGGLLSHLLEGYFKKVLKIDYKTIYEPGFLDEIELPVELIPHVRNLASEFDKYDFTAIDYEVMGNIFESLIPMEDRHKFGQYFTRSDVVDLIVGACVRNKDDIVLDPACGAGTFLIRSFSRLKYLGMKGHHREFLEKLWGVDIAKFPAHLTTINLVVKDLSERFNFPRIACDDFFNVLPNTLISESSFPVEGLNSNTAEKELPKFNAVVTNPPYTRQEEMEEKTGEGYKEDIIELIKKETGISVGRRSSIYSYFFFHGDQFLTPKGRLGLITSNSWLDVDYGKYLQEFFLKNFKIIAIIESKVERFFTEADVNTCITILEKCNGEKDRNGNVVKFVQLRQTLPKILSNFNKSKKVYEEWNDEEKWKATDKLLKWIEKTNEFVIDEDIDVRVFPIEQEKLWDEGFDSESDKYEGSKWGKYLRAPDIFFSIMEKGKDMLVPLKEIADVRRGFTSGANEFFYLTEEEIKRWGIEKEFWMHKEGKKWIPNYVIKSPRECAGLVVIPENLKFRVLMMHKDKDELEGTNLLKYIEWGEEQGFHERPTCASRKRWYELPLLPRADILFRQFFDATFNFPLKMDDMPTDHTFYYLCLKDKTLAKPYAALFNSSLYTLVTEIYGRTVMGQGVLIAYGPEMRPIPLINLGSVPKRKIHSLEKSFDKLSMKGISTIFEEIGANTPEEVSLDKVKKDRRKLDKIIMGEILDLTEDEQLEVYKAVIDLVRSRIEKAKSVKNKKKKIEKFEANVEQISVLVFHEIHKLLLLELKKIDPAKLDHRVITIPDKGAIDVHVDLSGAPKIKIGEKEISCETVDEAQYLKYNVLMGNKEIYVPIDKKILEKLIDRLKDLDKEVKKALKNMLNLTVTSEKIRNKIKDDIYENVWVRIKKFKID